MEIKRFRKKIFLSALIAIQLFGPISITLDQANFQNNHNQIVTVYNSQSVITELRGGINLTEAAWLFLILYMLNRQVNAFQPVKPPHHQLYPSSSFQNSHNFKTTSSSERETQLEGRKRQRAEIHIDMDDQYREFILTKNPNTNCSQQRFEELCRDPKTGKIDLSSIDEALGILEAEGRGLVKNASRPDKNVIDADFEIEGPGRYDLADLKTPINWGKGNQNLDQAAKNLAEKILNQRVRMQGYGKNPLHIVNLINGKYA